MNQECIEQAILLRDCLADRKLRIGFAESCTAGRVSATLGSIPGISSWLCGGFVIYRNDSKSKWLGIPESLLNNPAIGPVSAEVTRRLAHAVGDRTPEADWAVAVTGDVGPGASSTTDGKCFCAAFDKQRQQTIETTFRLHSPAPTTATDIQARIRRLDEATSLVLAFVRQSIQEAR